MRKQAPSTHQLESQLTDLTTSRSRAGTSQDIVEQQPTGARLDLKLQGGKGDGETDETALLSSLVRTLSATGGELYIPEGLYRITGEVQVPSTVSMTFAPGARLLLGSGAEVLLAGPIGAGLYQIFAGDGRVRLRGNARIKEVYPQWWGARGDGLADDQPAFQQAVLAISGLPSFAGESTGMILNVPMGTYLFGAPLNVPSNAGVGIVGAGKTKSNLIMATGQTSLLKISGNNIRGNIRDLRLTGQVGALAGTAISTTGQGNQLYIENCWINNFKYGIYSSPSSDSNYTGNVFEFVQTPIYCNSSNDIFISENMFYNCGPISQGGTEKEPTFNLTSSRRINFYKNRIITDMPSSPQSSGIFRVEGCESVLIEGNIENIATTQSGNNIVAVNSQRINISNNSFGKHLYRTVSISGSSGNINISGNQFTGSKMGSYSTIFSTGAFSGIIISGNNFSAASNTYDLVVDTGNRIIVENNVFDKGFSIDPGVGRCLIGSNINGTNAKYITSAPTFGTWNQGDYVPNLLPKELGATGNKYVVQGWRCVATGSPGSWVEVRTFTGN